MRTSELNVGPEDNERGDEVEKHAVVEQVEEELRRRALSALRPRRAARAENVHELRDQERVVHQLLVAQQVHGEFEHLHRQVLAAGTRATGSHCIHKHVYCDRSSHIRGVLMQTYGY